MLFTELRNFKIDRNYEPSVALICLSSVNEMQNKMKSDNWIEALKLLLSIVSLRSFFSFEVTAQIILKYKPNQVGFYLLWCHTESFLGSQHFFWSSDTKGGFSWEGKMQYASGVCALLKM